MPPPVYLDVSFDRMVNALRFALLSQHKVHSKHVMPTAGTSSSGEFSCATATQRTLRDLRTKRKGQPVLVIGHNLERKNQEATFEVFNQRLATVKFEDGTMLGYDPLELLLPTEIDDKGVAYFEIRTCGTCAQTFPLTQEEFRADEEPSTCPGCSNP